MNLESHSDGKSNMMFNYFNKKGSNSVPLLNDEEGRKRYVDWGVGDSMPYRLFELYNQSGFHRAIIDSRVNMILGDGVQQVQDVETSKRTEDFIKYPNQYDNMDELLKKVAYDYEIYGIGYIEFIYNNSGTAIVEMNHIDASKIRWGKKEGRNLSHVYYSKNWKRLSKYPPVGIPVHNPNLRMDYPRQILPIVRYTPSVDYYTLPSYYSVIKWISIDYEISNFHENNIQNGFAPTIFFGFPSGIPTEDERTEVEKRLKQKYSGSDNAGGVITAFYDGIDQKVDVQVLDITKADKQYEWLSNKTTEQILIGHKATKNVVGLETAGKLGSSAELLQAHELYFNDVIKHEQNDIIRAVNKLLTYNGMNNIEVINSKPLSQEFSENILAQILDRNEMRDIVGYEPIEDEVVEDDDLVGEVEEKELEKGDKFNFNGTELKLSQEEISASNPIHGNANGNDLYISSLGRGGLSKKNCPSCLKNAGQVRTLNSWKRTFIPAQKNDTTLGVKYRTAPYATFCEDKCTCKLIKIN